MELSTHALSGRNPKDISLNVLVASWVQLVLHNTSTVECSSRSEDVTFASLDSFSLFHAIVVLLWPIVVLNTTTGE